MNRWGLVLRDNVIGKTTHQVGLPKSLSGTEPQPLPQARLLVIQEQPDGFFLYRYSGDGDFAGDTWHASLEDAFGQAAFEFSVPPGDWAAIPPEQPDAVKFLRRGG
jgi:hypothetical protein